MRKPLFRIVLLVMPLAGCMADPASRGSGVGLATCGIELGLSPCGQTY